MSEIVRIDRDRLRVEVLRLLSLLKVVARSSDHTFSVAALSTVNFMAALTALSLIGYGSLPQEHGVAPTPSLSTNGETGSAQEDGAASSDLGLTEEASDNSRMQTLGEASPPG